KKTFTFYRVSHGASFDADQQLLDQVNESPYFHLKEADLNDCQIILVFCTINTRIESDVKAAMEKIPESAGDKPVILVVMHHTRDINFTTTRKKWKEKYERVQLDVEVLFHRSKKGLLTCEKNQKAVERIRKEVEKKWLKKEEKSDNQSGREKEMKQEEGETEERIEIGGGTEEMKKERGGTEEIKRDRGGTEEITDLGGGTEEIMDLGGGTEEMKQEGRVKEKGGHESSRKKPRTGTAL
ncbi:unnamed protein product, partial [Menidia menidia]